MKQNNTVSNDAILDYILNSELDVIPENVFKALNNFGIENIQDHETRVVARTLQHSYETFIKTLIDSETTTSTVNTP